MRKSVALASNTANAQTHEMSGFTERHLALLWTWQKQRRFSDAAASVHTNLQYIDGG